MRAPQKVMLSTKETLLIGSRIATRKGKVKSAVKPARIWAVPSRRQSPCGRRSPLNRLARAAPTACPARNARQHQRERVCRVVRDGREQSAGPQQLIRQSTKTRDGRDQKHAIPRDGNGNRLRVGSTVGSGGRARKPAVPGECDDADTEIDERRDHVGLNHAQP